jgi:hypothetical protein
MSYQSNEYCGVCHKDETIVLDNCPICLENITQINRTTTPCGHTFHGSCIFNFIIAAYQAPTFMSLICPLCRKIAFNNDKDGCQAPCCRPDLEGFRTSEEEDACDKAYQDYFYNDSENVPENVPENVSENVPENVPENVSENVLENVPENVPENVYDYSDFDSNSDSDYDSDSSTCPWRLRLKKLNDLENAAENVSENVSDYDSDSGK